MILSKEDRERYFTEEELFSLCRKALLEKEDFAGKSVLAIIPDATRSGPVGLIFKAISEALRTLRVKKLDFLIALGTHPPMSEEKINQYLGLSAGKRAHLSVGIFQHHWDCPEELVKIGVISAQEIEEISGGLLHQDIPVTLNRRVLDYQELILAGPVFPHEVVGFSGGYKYLFPGVAGPSFLHQFHWLGALITNPKINGTKDTPVRRALNRAASFLSIPINNLCYVVKENKVYGLYFGGEDAWSAAADLSAKLNIRYLDKPFHTVLSMAPVMYEDLWTAGKCMYKLEPVVADGGTLIIYAPHIKEVSYTHGEMIKKVGYHTRDYFWKQWDRFKDFPGAILAHSTHVKGIGTYHNGRESERINVVLATGIPEEICRQINLGYRDWRTIKVEDYEGKEAQGILMVENAGEVLYRLSDGSVPDIETLFGQKEEG